MKDPHDIILGPIITERSVEMSMEGRFQFRVAIDASKIEIEKAIEAIYSKDNVKVVKVNTTVVKGKTKRLGMKPPGKKPNFKKASVKLMPGQTISDFAV